MSETHKISKITDIFSREAQNEFFEAHEKSPAHSFALLVGHDGITGTYANYECYEIVRHKLEKSHCALDEHYSKFFSGKGSRSDVKLSTDHCSTVLQTTVIFAVSKALACFGTNQSPSKSPSIAPPALAWAE